MCTSISLGAIGPHSLTQGRNSQSRTRAGHKLGRKDVGIRHTVPREALDTHTHQPSRSWAPLTSQAPPACVPRSSSTCSWAAMQHDHRVLKPVAHVNPQRGQHSVAILALGGYLSSRSRCIQALRLHSALRPTWYGMVRSLITSMTPRHTYNGHTHMPPHMQLARSRGAHAATHSPDAVVRRVRSLARHRTLRAADSRAAARRISLACSGDLQRARSHPDRQKWRDKREKKREYPPTRFSA